MTQQVTQPLVLQHMPPKSILMDNNFLQQKPTCPLNPHSLYSANYYNNNNNNNDNNDQGLDGETIMEEEIEVYHHHHDDEHAFRNGPLPPTPSNNHRPSMNLARFSSRLVFSMEKQAAQNPQDRARVWVQTATNNHNNHNHNHNNNMDTLVNVEQQQQQQQQHHQQLAENVVDSVSLNLVGEYLQSFLEGDLPSAQHCLAEILTHYFETEGTTAYKNESCLLASALSDQATNSHFFSNSSNNSRRHCATTTTMSLLQEEFGYDNNNNNNDYAMTTTTRERSCRQILVMLMDVVFTKLVTRRFVLRRPNIYRVVHCQTRFHGTYYYYKTPLLYAGLALRTPTLVDSVHLYRSNSQDARGIPRLGPIDSTPHGTAGYCVDAVQYFGGTSQCRDSHAGIPVLWTGRCVADTGLVGQCRHARRGGSGRAHGGAHFPHVH